MDHRDFFEDEESVASDTTPKPSPSRKDTPAGEKIVPVKEKETVTIPMVILLMIIGVLIGLVLGYGLRGALTPEHDHTHDTEPLGTPIEQTQPGRAPALDQDIMEQGVLPQGHPDISEMAGEGAGSEETPTETAE